MKPVPTEQERQSPLRILIVQQNPLLRLGLRSVLERAGMEVVGETVELEEMCVCIKQSRPDVMLLDGALMFHDSHREYTAAEVVAHLRRACRFFVLVSAANEESLFQFMCSGAAAYELAILGCDALVEKIRRVAADEYIVTSEVLQQPVLSFYEREQCLLQEVGCTSSTQELQKKKKLKTDGTKVESKNTTLSVVQQEDLLTERECEVLVCIMHGCTNKQAASRLGISDQTIKNHISRINERLGSRDRTEAVVAAIRLGLISWDDPLPSQQESFQGPLRVVELRQKSGPKNKRSLALAANG